MNESRKIGLEKKAQVMNRVVEERQLLLERGFNATLIELEDIHLIRRQKEDLGDRRIKEYIKTKGGQQSDVKTVIKQVVDKKVNALIEKPCLKVNKRKHTKSVNTSTSKIKNETPPPIVSNWPKNWRFKGYDPNKKSKLGGSLDK